MNHKTEQINRLTNYLQKKYGSTNIIVTDYWEGDNAAIGLTDKSKQFTVYINDYGKRDNRFFVSLEYPPTSEDFPYTPGENFENLTTEDVEKIIVKHLKIFSVTSDEIKEIISEELKVEPDINNVFGLDLTKCLIEPVKQKYKNSNDSTDIYELWTVLEENEDKSGYKIYFDEESKKFGLAIKSDKDELIDIGNYGTFLKTLYSM